MRFILAIISFLMAALMIGYGVAQRTVFAEPDEVALTDVIKTGSAVTVIDGTTLNAFAGSQSLSISGADKIVAAYGRTADVLAWIGDTQYTAVSYDAKKDALTSKLVAGANKIVPDPTNSDLWLDDYEKDKTLTVTVKVPDTVSFIIVSDGTKAAPTNLRLSWPLDNSTPWSGPLIVGGAVVLLLGLVLLLWATNHLRRANGPRRKPHKMPRVPRQRAIRSGGRKGIAAQASGRRRGMIAVPIVLVGALALAGCTSISTSKSASSPSPSPASSSGAADSGLEPPAVTVRQVQRIVSRISAVAATADKSGDATLIATRFDGAALQLRLANYAIRRVDPAIGALAAIPDGPVKLTLPQQTDGWPRTVFAVIQDDKDATIPPVAVFLEQRNARSDYKVSYAITLEPAAQLPDVAPANVGAPRLAADSGVLKMTPAAVALAYGDILEKDVDSSSFLDFEEKGDSLRTNVGLKNKQDTRAALPATASVAFGHAIGPAAAIALATNDSGAIVAVNLNETTTVAPLEAGAAVNPSGAVKALSSIAVTTKGVVATYGDQLLFYVPPAGSKGKIILLGYSQGLVTATEIG